MPTRVIDIGPNYFSFKSVTKKQSKEINRMSAYQTDVIDYLVRYVPRSPNRNKAMRLIGEAFKQCNSAICFYGADRKIKE